MARIAGVDLPAKKRAEIGLTYIYGIGRTRALSLLHRAGVDAGKKVADLTEDEVNQIRTLIENEGAVEGDLRKELSMNIKRLIEMGSYRGVRHRRGLPVRGQRTHTNARTRKGPRRATIAGKKKATAKPKESRWPKLPKKKQPRKRRSRRKRRRSYPRPRAHPGLVQQHDRDLYGLGRQRTGLVEFGIAGVPRIEQGNAIRRAAGILDGRQQGQGIRVAVGGSASERSGRRPGIRRARLGNRGN